MAVILIVASAACTVTESPSTSPVPTPSATPPVTPSPQPSPLGQVGDAWFLVPNVPEAGAQVRAVTAGGPGWVAVGSACPVPPADCESHVPAAWGSPDGAVWTRATRVPAIDFGEMTAVAWDGSSLYAAGTVRLTQGTIWRSADARVWEQVGSGPAFDLGACFEGCPSLEAVAAGAAGVVVNGLRIVVTGERIAGVPTLWFSADGIDWSAVGAPTGHSPTNAIRISHVAAGGPGFVAVGQVCDPRCRATTWTSPDGLEWSGPADLPDGADARPLRVVAGGDRVVVIAERCPADDECTAVTTWSSADATTWSEAPIEGESSSRLPDLLAESGGYFIALTSLGGRITVWSSTDATTWEQRRSEGLPGVDERYGIFVLDLAAGPLGALLIGEYETAQGLDTRAWISPGR